ncbi:hypothetical protein PHISP_05002 [Aspergillus sp. HF37]|nr:hypothetical protein PHISP_05002 [Aspergillus sp. HF37]
MTNGWPSSLTLHLQLRSQPSMLFRRVASGILTLAQGKRIFIKDIIHYLLPPERQPGIIAPSLDKVKRGVGTDTSNGDGHVNGHSNGVNGHANGTNGHANGVNGHANGVNGHSNGINGHANGINGHSNGINGHSNGINGHANGINGHANGVNGHAANGTSKHEGYPFATPREPGNPTVMPNSILSRFHFVFLIRDPHHSIPSYYRCTIPPLDDITGFHNYDPAEAGYDEVRRVFEYLRNARLIGPHLATRGNEVVDEGADGVFQPVPAGEGGKGSAYDSGIDICVVDADEMLQKPGPMMEAFCDSVGIKYDPGMLSWDTEDDYRHAANVFEKWRGFHNDVIESAGLNAKQPHSKSEETYDAEWRQKFGDEAAALIRRTVDENMADYLYMKQFTMKV